MEEVGSPSEPASNNTSSLNLRAVVDIGSNGIRFSISDTTPAIARILPTVFQDRAPISLYDAQYSTGTKMPVPTETIKDILDAILQFKQTCQDFGVSDKQVRIVATEAMREASNPTVLREEIALRSGWQVEMLDKEQESRTGAMGVASSFGNVEGLVMDLGGGSVQLAWMETVQGDVQVYGSSSHPYGAAALTRLMDKAAQQAPINLESLTKELEEAFKTSIANIHDATDGRSSAKSTTLYLSGGGFRGWGQIVMDKHALSPYPIATINGFRITAQDFSDAAAITSHLDAKTSRDEDVFRISDRRSTQVPAVALLVTCLVRALPQLESIYFSQGGVREGILFADLPVSTRAEHPLTAATQLHAPSSHILLLALVRDAIPSGATPPASIINLLVPFVNLLYAHRAYPKGGSAPAALRSTTTGLLGPVHGLTHEERAVLALILCERWGGDLPPRDMSFAGQLRLLAGRKAVWWAGYIGAVGSLVATVYPAGVVGEKRLELRAGLEGGEIGVVVGLAREQDEKTFGKAIKGLAKVGKKKNWVGGKQGWGIKVSVSSSLMSRG